MQLKCKVCKSDLYTFAQGILLGKYEVDYFKCSNCGFIQTEEPYWIEEAYSDAIAKTDVGLVFRNNNLSRQAAHIIYHLFNHDAKFLDYGGGYGLFVRMMRDFGFNFYWSDKFCTNLFAKGFELDEAVSDSYELVTAFEVFEHFVNPTEEIENILKFSRNVLFSTELLPENNPKPNEWWYYAPHEGQHISIYTLETLSKIADKYDLNLYSNGSSLHLLTEKKLPPDLFITLCQSQPEALNKKSLLQSDYSKAVSSLINSNSHNFISVSEEVPHSSEQSAKILVDGVFFQLYKTGIARVWKSLLEEWVNNGFAKHIILLDRAGTAPKIPGVRYRLIPAYDYNNTDSDREILQQVCDEECADLFISSYYTTPIATPSVFLAHDMIPEVFGWNLNHPMWQEKHYGIQHASAYIAVSENTAQDLVKCFPDISLESVIIAKNGVNHQIFSPAQAEELNDFKSKYGITKPYFILVGAGNGYKNSILFFQAFSKLANSYGFDIVSTGIGGLADLDFRAYTSGSIVHILQLSDEELAIAYSGAIALIYPSKYEGFGLPVLEAIACGCPVITCPNASIPEVAGKAALYVQDDDVEQMANALCEVQKPSVRNSLIAAGLEQAKQFSWANMAKVVSSTLINTTLLPLNLREINLIVFPDWLQPEESLGLELQRVISAIATHPASEQITLLIDTNGISSEDVELFLSGVAMNLLMEEDLDITEGLQISLVSNLADIQWEALLPRIQARIILSAENQEANALYGVNIPAFELESFTVQQIEQLFLNRSNGFEAFSKQVVEMKDQQFNNSIIYNIKEISISLPHDHALPQYQNRFRLYDKFLGVLAKHLPNNQDFIVDIGANVGDTTALLLQYCLNPILCIEADEDFFCLLKENLSEYKQRISFVNSFVSGTDFKNVELVKSQGTARAVETKNKIVKSDSLESIIKNSNSGKCILLKTDTDGFDFEILLSSLSIIKEDSPILYWENEISSLKDLEMAKDLLNKLADINYTKYIILDNFGNPLIYEGCSQLVDQINEYLLNNRYTQHSTFYYTDIAAFPDRYSHLILEIASDYNKFIRSSNVYP
ncbi:FkbM family methyltransferase [Scytonema hofmannii FACHB-248]|uniref:FkbM family methyltransferase n=1 Tax=Scytonema hofmannii FACHB-248 TaxID=1842502 RepID=A0ABR8H0S2_9CYAN|nr:MULTISPECIES: FkbM family methyltransferase [Nostocales]MBD2609422.1 FkbM family methyltransferase [Scytonema hofmannii FACHB-248]